ncbi:MAG: hypothetical protein R2852_06505 [Bacteroidia bacterium]
MLNPHDSDYLQQGNSSKSLVVSFDIKDDYCPYPKSVRISTTLQLTAPDSSGFVSAQMYSDKNKNLNLDLNEKGFEGKLLVQSNNSTFTIKTDTIGRFADSIGIGTYKSVQFPTLFTMSHQRRILHS